MISWSLSIVSASDSVKVYIYPLHQPVPWKGKTFSMSGGTYWAGEIHIQYNGTPPSSGTHTRAYCMQYDVILHTGTTYDYSIVDAKDDPKWRSISYILSWYDPPIDNDNGAAVQGAIWKILTGSDPSGYGLGLASEANGKDVIRVNDTLEWITPISYIGPNEVITLTAVLKNATGFGRPNVRVLFNTSGGTLDKYEGFTDSNGEVSVILTAPSENCLVEVSAYTKGVWPKRFLCTDRTQNLIGLGDEIGLTVKTDILVFAKIFVVPELPFGTIAAVTTCFLALIIKNRLRSF